MKDRSEAVEMAVRSGARRGETYDRDRSRRLLIWAGLGVVLVATALAGIRSFLLPPRPGPVTPAADAGLGGSRTTPADGALPAATDTATSGADAGEPAPEFTLIDSAGRTVTLADLRGKVWVANFIFTRCGTVCPTLTREMSSVREELVHQGAGEVVSVSFSIDPIYDSPEVLRRYAENYGADPRVWLFLTGDPKEMLTVVRDGFHLMMSEPGEGAPMHSNRFVIVGTDGRVRSSHLGTDEGVVAEIVADALALYREAASAGEERRAARVGP